MANNRLSDLLQFLVYVAVHKDEACSSQRIASSLNSNASLVRQMLSQLRNAGIISVRQGKSGISINKDLNDLTMLDVYKAIDNQGDLFKVDANTSKTCNVGVAFPEVLQEHYHELQRQVEKQMSKISLQELVDETKESIEKHTRENDFINSPL